VGLAPPKLFRARFTYDILFVNFQLFLFIYLVIMSCLWVILTSVIQTNCTYLGAKVLWIWIACCNNVIGQRMRNPWFSTSKDFTSYIHVIIWSVNVTSFGVAGTHNASWLWRMLKSSWPQLKYQSHMPKFRCWYSSILMINRFWWPLKADHFH